MNLRQSIIKVFFANLLQLFTSIIVGFFVPAVLSVDAYASLRTYTFYITYVGFLHLGFVDGMYIKYGGKNPTENDKGILKGEHRFFFIFQTIVSVVIAGIAILIGNVLWLLIGLSVILINGYSFHKMYYQATGQFSKYTGYAYAYSLVYLALNVLLAVILKNKDANLYCLTTVIANLVVLLVLEGSFYKNFHRTRAIYDKKGIRNNISVGFFVLLGNLSVTMFYAIDQWFVKFGMTTDDFAYYSFAISLLNMVTVLVNAVTITFYNYLAREKNDEKLRNIKKYLVILGSLASFGYFPLAFIIDFFLEKYIPALSVISISFAAYPYMIVINAIYVNLYKVQKDERKYLWSVVKMLIVAIIYNIIGMLIWNNIESIAFATTFSFITWYFYAMRHFPALKSDWKELLYLCLVLISFLLCSHISNYFIGAVIYLIILIVGIVLFFKDLLKASVIKGFIFGIRQKK